jgi:hypothetical protein
VPLDASFVQVAPAEPAAEQAPVIEETPDVSPESLPQQPDEVRDVLNGMFTLFEKQKSEPLQPGKVTRKGNAEVQPAKAEKPAAPKVPKPNTGKAAPEVERKTLFDRLFRAKNRDDKTKKKKTLFNF